MTTYAGALHLGPDIDNTRYYSAPLGTTPTGDFSIFFLVRLHNLYIDDPAVSSAKYAAIGQSMVTDGGGTSGNDNYLRVYPLNSGTTASAGKLKFRLVAGSVLASTSTSLTGTTVWKNNDALAVVIQSNGGVIEMRSCKVGSGTVTLEASETRNASYTAKSLQTWLFGNNNTANFVQAVGVGSKALTDAEIISLAGGTDPDTIYSSGQRTNLWVFDSTSATISNLWGATGATRNGTFVSNQAVAPVFVNATARIGVSNETPVYGPVASNDDGTAPTRTWTGTYTGFTPATFQYRVEHIDGTLVTDWTNLTSFTASAGTWSGVAQHTLGGPHRIMFRDSADTTKLWAGGKPFVVGPVTASVGQSPHVIFERSYKGATTLTAPLYFYLTGYDQVMKGSTANTGGGLAAAANAVAALNGNKPLTMILTAIVGTSSSQWAAKDASVWPQFLQAINYCKPARVLIQWLNGAADSSTGVIKSNHDTILTNLDTDLTTTRSIAYRYKMLPHQRQTSAPTGNGLVRRYQYEWARDHAQAGTKVLLGPWWGDAQMDLEWTSAVASATSTTVVLATTDFSTATSQYVGATITVVSGTGAGQTKTVTAYNSTTHAVTTSAWTTTPDATSVVRIYGSTPHQCFYGGVDKYGAIYGTAVASSFGFSSHTGRGPVPAAVTYPNGGDGSILDVTFTHRHGSNLRTPLGGTTAANVAGFEVSEDSFSTTKIITSAVITGPTTVRLTLSAAPTSKAALLVRYGAQEPVASSLFDSTTAGLGTLLYDDSSVGTNGAVAYFTTADLAATEAPAASTALVSAGFFALA